ncbi:MAG: prenyltransferase/squalene oxidase repeat-containing protein [Gemmataceae bacterium]
MRNLPLTLLTALVVALAAPAQEVPKPGQITPDEPLAKEFSTALAARALDSASLHWTRQRQCGACHTNYPYLLARPALAEQTGDSLAEVNRFFEERVKNWDRGNKGDAPRWDTEVVATAATMALADARTGQLRPLTRQALDRMWTLQKPSGAWDWLKCGWPPMEHDDYYGAVYAAFAVGMAPGDYAQTEKAKAGLEKLKGYLAKNPPPETHHALLLAMASKKLEGLMTEDQRKELVARLRKDQRADGGWNLASLGRTWKGNDGRKPDTNSPSDAYATGLSIMAITTCGNEKDLDAVNKGADWLLKNQRASGRWFTRSLNNDRHHYITNAGSAYAILALEAAGKLSNQANPGE